MVVEEYAGKWISPSDHIRIICSPLSSDTIRCTFISAWGGAQNNAYMYIINGSRITLLSNAGIKGTHNGIDRITWSTGSMWVKQGKVYTADSDENKVYTL